MRRGGRIQGRVPSRGDRTAGGSQPTIGLVKRKNSRVDELEVGGGVGVGAQADTRSWADSKSGPGDEG